MLSNLSVRITSNQRTGASRQIKYLIKMIKTNHRFLPLDYIATQLSKAVASNTQPLTQLDRIATLLVLLAQSHSNRMTNGVNFRCRQQRLCELRSFPSWCSLRKTQKTMIYTWSSNTSWERAWKTRKLFQIFCPHIAPLSRTRGSWRPRNCLRRNPSRRGDDCV